MVQVGSCSPVEDLGVDEQRILAASRTLPLHSFDRLPQGIPDEPPEGNAALSGLLRGLVL